MKNALLKNEFQRREWEVFFWEKAAVGIARGLRELIFQAAENLTITLQKSRERASLSPVELTKEVIEWCSGSNIGTW